MGIVFQNNVVAGTVLIREAIQSQDFGINSDGTTNGWQINADGSATFNDVTIGSTNYTIDSNGNGNFNDVNVADDLFLDGVSLSDTLAGLPAGLIGYGDSAAANVTASQWTVDSAAIAGTAVGVIEFDFGPIDVTHIYRITVGFNYSISSGAGTNIYRSTLRYTVDGTTPTTGGLILDGSDIDLAPAVAASVERYNQTFFYYSNSSYDIVRTLLTIQRTTGASGTLTVNLNDANTKAMFAIEDLGLKADAVAGGSLSQQSKSSGTPDPPPTKTYKKTYNANWSRAWNNGGAAVYATNGDLKQGFISGSGAGGALGNAVSWIGFPFSTIQSDLSGATVNKVEAYFYFNHWYNDAGGTAIIGTHKSTATSAPSYSSSLDNQDRKSVGGWNANQGQWIDITSAVGNDFKSGAATGLVLGQGPSNSATYYGKANGFSQSHAPQLRVTYTK